MEQLLEHAASLGQHPSRDALHKLAAELKALAQTLDVAEVSRLVSPESARHFLGEHPDGPIVGLGLYGPGHVSSVHGHAWTIILVLDGAGTLERWRANPDGEATLMMAEATSAAPVVLTDYEGHRQRTTVGALELVLVGDYTDRVPKVEYRPDPASLAFADRFDGFLAAWSGADIDALGGYYADDVFLDLHVPKWRVQVEGKDKTLAFINAEEFQADYSVPRWSVAPTPDGWVFELQAHYTYNGGQSFSEMVHRVRLDDDERIVQQHVYCTGIWDPATIEGLRHSGGLPRP